MGLRFVIPWTRFHCHTIFEIQFEFRCFLRCARFAFNNSNNNNNINRQQLLSIQLKIRSSRHFNSNQCVHGREISNGIQFLMKIIKIKAHTERTYRHTWTTSNMNAEPRGQGRQKKTKIYYRTEQNRTIGWGIGEKNAFNGR